MGLWNEQISDIFSLPQSSSTPDAQTRRSVSGSIFAGPSLFGQRLSHLSAPCPPMFEHLWRRAGIGTVAITQHFFRGPCLCYSHRDDWSSNRVVSWGFAHPQGVCVAHRLRWEGGPCSVGLHIDPSVRQVTHKD